MQRRRRFLRVRAAGGREGWTEESQLLNAGEMADLKELSERAAALPPQGKGTTYGALNVHTQPQVGSPSFLQIKDGEKFDVLVEVISPRVPIERPPLIPPAEKKAAAPRRPAKAAKIPPPPLPPPPGPPPNWLELSKTNLAADEQPADQPEAKPVPTDHWSLVRTASGESGWVLTRRINMAIPDDVAQYAEGRRIVSYFPLGYVEDGDAKKPNWLWTTIGDSHQPYDFDSFRVFIWSLRRHRYETAYIERNLAGYAPVLLKQVQVSANARGKTATQEFPGFSVCTEKADGQLHRREFALLGNVVHSAGEEPCQRAGRGVGGQNRRAAGHGSGGGGPCAAPRPFLLRRGSDRPPQAATASDPEMVAQGFGGARPVAFMAPRTPPGVRSMALVRGV